MATSADRLAGVLPIDKPAGPTSHDVVLVVRRVLGTRRVGHTGTLDPFASGLLLLCVGPATRLAEYLTGLAKSYQAVLRLGEQTDTGDPTGRVTHSSEGWRELASEDVAAGLARLQGRHLQVPPQYSAKKVAGERLYEKARRGEPVSVAPVEIEITSIRLTDWNPPCASFETTCSSGTYVRAIARDLGADLGCFAHLVGLRRTAVGPHRLTGALPLAELSHELAAGRLLSPQAALPHMPSVEVDDALAAAIRNGRAIPASPDLAAPAVLIVWRHSLLAIGAAASGRLAPHKVFDA